MAKVLSSTVIESFLHRSNKSYLLEKILNTVAYSVLAKDDKELSQASRNKLQAYLQDNLTASMRSYTVIIEDELDSVDMLDDAGSANILRRYNNNFVRDQSRYIAAFVLHNDHSGVAKQTDGAIKSQFIKTNPDVDDGKNTGWDKSNISMRNPSQYAYQDHKGVSADDLLKRWDLQTKTRSGGQFRDDSQGDIAPADGYRHAAREVEVEYYDYSDMNTSHAYETFINDPVMIAMNKTDRPHELKRFGSSDIANDARLLGRSIGRKNERGEEHGIPYYERRLYRRNYERDIEEGLGSSAQYDCHIRGYDMSDF